MQAERRAELVQAMLRRRLKTRKLKLSELQILLSKMRHIISIALFMLAVCGQAQTFQPIIEDSIDFVITGTTTSQYDSLVVFPCAPHGQGVEYPVVDGQFRVAGRYPRHSFIQIGDYAGNDFRFIVEETPTDINLVTGEVKGSELQQKFIQCQMRERAIEHVVEPWWEGFSDEEQDRMRDMIMGEGPIQTAEDSANVEKYKRHMSELETVNVSNIRENLNNIIPAYYLYTGMGSLTYEQMSEFMREDSPYACHPAMERPWKVYYSIQKQRNITSKTYIDFEAEDPDGTMHRLSEYAGHGQYVLIDFWASWCGPCIASFPRLRWLYEQYNGRGLSIVGVSLDKNREAWISAIEQHGLPWTALRSPSSTGESVKTDAADLYGIATIPALILISPEGTILSTDKEGRDLEAYLEQIFQANNTERK